MAFPINRPRRLRNDLGWKPRYDFAHALGRLRAGQDPRSPLALAVGAKGYHTEPTGAGVSDPAVQGHSGFK